MRITRLHGVHTITYIISIHYIGVYIHIVTYTHMSSTTNLNYFCRMCVRVSLDRIHALVTAC